MNKTTTLPANIQRAIDFIHANALDKINVDSIAGVAGLSPHHFSRLFKRHTGDSPRRYINRLRMKIARTMIESGASTIADAAALIGYSDQSHFTAAFKAEFGLTPGQCVRR